MNTLLQEALKNIDLKERAFFATSTVRELAFEASLDALNKKFGTKLSSRSLRPLIYNQEDSSQFDRHIFTSQTLIDVDLTPLLKISFSDMVCKLDIMLSFGDNPDEFEIRFMFNFQWEHVRGSNGFSRSIFLQGSGLIYQRPRINKIDER